MAVCKQHAERGNVQAKAIISLSVPLCVYDVCTKRNAFLLQELPFPSLPSLSKMGLNNRRPMEVRQQRVMW